MSKGGTNTKQIIQTRGLTYATCTVTAVDSLAGSQLAMEVSNGVIATSGWTTSFDQLG